MCFCPKKEKKTQVIAQLTAVVLNYSHAVVAMWGLTDKSKSSK